MERVVELFVRYRSRELALKELTTALREFLLHHPQAARQGLGWLDLAQQRQPMPVTEFIQLRADMDYLLRSLSLQSPAVAPPRTDRATPTPLGDTVNQRPSATPAKTTPPPDDDATVTGTLATVISPLRRDDDDDNGAATVIAVPVASKPLVDGDATQMAISQDATLPGARASEVAETLEATVVVAPPAMEPTILAQPRPQGQPAAKTQVPQEATRVASPRDAAPKMPHSQRVPPRTADSATTATAPPQRTAAPVIGIIGGIAVAILLVSGVALWNKSALRDQQEAAAPDTEITLTPDTTAPAEVRSVNADPGSSESADTVMLQLEVVDDRIALSMPAAATSVTPAAATPSTPAAATSGSTLRPSVQPILQPPPVEPLPNDIEGLLASVKKRIGKGHLLPAADPNSATFAIKALIAKAPQSTAVSDARRELSQAHLELARQAREKGDLDAAQTHLDDAFEVRLMK